MINNDDIIDEIKTEMKKQARYFLEIAYLSKKIATRECFMMISLVIYISAWLPMMFSETYDVARVVLTIIYNCIYWPVFISNNRLKRKVKPIQKRMKESINLTRDMIEKNGIEMEDLE